MSSQSLAHEPWPTTGGGSWRVALRPLIALLAAGCLLAAGAPPLHASNTTTAPASLRGSLWGIELNGSNYRLLTAARVASLRAHGIDTVVVRSVALSSARLAGVLSRARRARLSVYVPLEEDAPSSQATVQAAEASCRSLKVASPGSRCAVQARTASSALSLARSRLVDLVVVRVSGPGSVAALRGTHERILAVAPLAHFSRRALVRAVQVTRRNGNLDFGVAPAGRRAARALARYSSLLSSLVPVKRDRTSPPPPSTLVSTVPSATTLPFIWRAPASGKPSGYDLYLNGALSSRTNMTRTTFSGLVCAHTYLVEVDARDAAGNRSQKRSASFSTGACLGGGGRGGLREANLWVDASGGSCTRSAAPIRYEDATACPSLDAAYGAAGLGDMVGVKGGDYPKETLVERSDKAATGDLPDVVFASALGETVRLASLQLGTGGIGGTGTNGPDHITVENMSASGSDCSWTIEGDSNDITWRNLDACNFGIDASNDITIDGGDWGPCDAGSDGCGNNHLYGNGSTNITIENAVFHDFTKTNDSQHFECLIDFGTGGTTGLTIRNNWFHNCVVYDIFLQQLGETIRPITIENNVFDHSTGNGYPVGDYSNGEWRSIAFSPRHTPFSNVLVRFNSFQAEGGISINDDGDGTTYSNFRVSGNLIGHSDCGVAGVTYGYNVYDGSSTCNGTGEIALRAPFPYINPAVGAQGDYHLAGAVTAIDNLVPTNVPDGCPATDYDGQARPQSPGSKCDAGADER